MAGQLDHYVGRSVIGVEEQKDISGIILEGEIVVAQPTKLYEKFPPLKEINGLSLMVVTIHKDKTTLYFGNVGETAKVVIELNPLDYFISDPNYNEGDPVFPQRFPEFADTGLPSDPSAERDPALLERKKGKAGRVEWQW